MSGNMTFNVDSDLNGASPQFTLTCISTGGPATVVIWARESGTVIGDEKSVLDDATTAQYTHTLTVTGGSGMGRLYTCVIGNEKPSFASATYTIQGNMVCKMTFIMLFCYLCAKDNFSDVPIYICVNISTFHLAYIHYSNCCSNYLF